jgi:hypothetical protein
MAPDFVHQIIEQAYKTALEVLGDRRRFRREYHAKLEGRRYYDDKAPSAEGHSRIHPVRIKDHP